MLQSAIVQLSNQINAYVASIGKDHMIEMCENMYSASFKSGDFKLGEFENWQNEVKYLKFDYVIYQYGKQHKLPTKPPYGASDYIIEMYYDTLNMIVDEFSEQFPIEIDENTLVVDLCNYKGEGEGGLRLSCISNEFPLYISKNQSFYQANRL